MAKSAVKLVTALLIIGVMIYLAAFGISIGNMTLQPVSESIKKGLDIAGGSIIVFEAEADNVSKEQSETVVSILRERLTNEGYTEAIVTTQGEKRFQVEIPAVTDPNEAVKLLGTTAKLSFVDPDGQEVLSAEDIQEAKAAFEPTKSNSPSENIVKLTLKQSGVEKFAAATERVSKAGDGKNYISIKLDEEIISSPRVSEKIESESCYISGGFTAESSKQLAGLIRAGQLPFNIKEISMSSVGATLGESALDGSLRAAFISILLVMLYMILFYRLPGIVASISLSFYVVITLLILGLLRINLTLPGIAGIILSVGMAVDANVVIFERIIDELKNGKTLRASIDAGFHRAMTAVVDSNITTLISAGVLWWLGAGTVKGFATTLFLGVIISMFTAITVTKFLVDQLIGLNVKNRSLYGIGVK